MAISTRTRSRTPTPATTSLFSRDCHRNPTDHHKISRPLHGNIRKMAPTRKFGYVSLEWLDAVAVIIADLLDGHDLDSLDFCICEDLTNPPPGRANTPAGTLSWFIRIRHNELEVGGGSVEYADIRIVADYVTHHELSRRAWAGNPEAIAASEHRRELATDSGKLRIEGDLTAAPSVVRQLVMQLHDPVAAITA
ncbi:hypothetical protein [Nocardia sp. NPDC004123]